MLSYSKVSAGRTVKQFDSRSNRPQIHSAASGTAFSLALAVLLFAAFSARSLAQTRTGEAPLMRDFMGLNVHTVQFKPDLYQPICRLVRDYHGLDWDVGSDTGYSPKFPMARNGVDWQALYGGWGKTGYTVDVCLMVGQTPAAAWRDMAANAFSYGQAFATYFGPSGIHKYVESIEIGNEPGNYKDADYRKLFQNMAQGLRKGDPRLKIVTCAATPGPSEAYAKSLTCVQGLERLYDVINIHTYAQVVGYPTWRRSYPEDPSIDYLKKIDATIAWRNQHAPGKPVWVTEFGWDATTKPDPPTGDFSRWVGSTETQQAEYLVRSFLVFSAMDMGRAYIFYFNDEDEPHVHGSSGLTRNFKPKPSFYAVAHLYKTLSAYRFHRVVVQRPGDLYIYEYERGTDLNDRVWAVWSPTGTGREADMAIPAPYGLIRRSERMPLTADAPQPVVTRAGAGKTLKLHVTEAPTYLWWRPGDK